jgi:hypothetical protein
MLPGIPNARTTAKIPLPLPSMSTVESKQKLFTYWRARFQVEPYGTSLQTLLEAAFAKTKIKDRVRKPQAKYIQIINSKSLRDGFFCGAFLAYEEGSSGQVVSSRLDRDAVEPEALPPQKASDGSQGEFVDGKLYFACKNNHVILVQERHLGAKHLETYLNEMLHTRPSGLPEKQSLFLERSIPREKKKQVEGISGIKLSGPVHYTPQRLQLARSETQVRSIPGGTMWDAIRGILPKSVSDRLATEGVTDPKDIDVSIQLKWKHRKRKEKVSDELDALANTFRHIDDELDFEAVTTSGAVLRKDELRLQKLISVRHRDGIPLNDDLFDKLIAWYGDLNNSGNI